MKKRNIIIIMAILLILIAVVVIGNFNKDNIEENDNLKIVTSFYPIYIMTLNITNGAENIDVSNMAENYVGCIHDYTLTTTDLKKFENADIFIENGYDMEQFSQKIIDSYPNVKLIDSSTKIAELAKKNVNDIKQEDISNGTNVEFDIVQEGNDINPHFWTSIDNYILQVETITEELKKLDTANNNLFEQNKDKYIQKLQSLKQQYEEQNFKNNSVVSLNESFSYLFKFIGVNEKLIETDHEQSALSAETVKAVIEEIKKEGIQAIVIGQNDDDQNANLIANETGAKVYRLNDAMSGDNSLDSYINVMQENLKILQTMF